MAAVMQPASSLPPAAPGQWQASLQLMFAQTARGCRLVHSAHQGPLYVQKPFYPEGSDLAHVYLLHPPGGLVSGDRLTISVQLQAQARVMLTTPGAGRVYRARRDRTLQQQCTNLVLHDNAVLEYLPQETIVYSAASAQLHTRVDMAPGSAFIGWEICCLGLPASDLRFNNGELTQRFSIYADSIPVLIERFVINDETRLLYNSSAGLRQQPVTALMVSGPFSPSTDTGPLMDELRALISSQIHSASPSALCAVTRLNGFIVVRYLGARADEARQLFVLLWQVLRPLLCKRQACPPRIWAT